MESRFKKKWAALGQWKKKRTTIRAMPGFDRLLIRPSLSTAQRSEEKRRATPSQSPRPSNKPEEAATSSAQQLNKAHERGKKQKKEACEFLSTISLFTLNEVDILLGKIFATLWYRTLFQFSLGIWNLFHIELSNGFSFCIFHFSVDIDFPSCS
jgi:hypothetical protein